MPNLFKIKKPAAALPATQASVSFDPMMNAKPGVIGGWLLRRREGQAHMNVRETAITEIEREAVAVVKLTVQMHGQQVRAEHVRVNAQVLGALGNELTANAAASFQLMGGTRFGASVTNIESRAAMLCEVERLIAEGAIAPSDAQALVETAMALHAETEGRQDRVFEGAVGMVERAYEGATNTAKQINE